MGWKAILGTMLVCVPLGLSPAVAQSTVPNVDVLGTHNLAGGTGGVSGPNSNSCIYCHASHGGASATLWNQTLSNQPYELYSSDTAQNTTMQPSISRPSQLCLSCHDGTVAVGQSIAYGKLRMSGNMLPSDVFGTKLAGSHPFSFQLPIKDVSNLVPQLVASHTTKDTAVKLVDENIECSTCHNVHNQFIDKRNQNFLVRDNANGQLCLACHEVAPRTVGGRTNTLERWTTSIHATSAVRVAPKAGLGYYSTLAEFACASCHAQHNATAAGLIRNNPNRPPNTDDTSQTCFTCHDGSDNLAEPIRNILSEYQKTGHPFADSNNLHSPVEATLLNNNRHATCEDCHQAHAAAPTASFTVSGELRASQTGVSGVTVAGSTVAAATYQYENCLRCHGASTGKQSLPQYGYLPARNLYTGDPLNVLLEFSNTAASAHPVMRDATGISQPSLLSHMWDLSGTVQSRPMGTRVFCTDCHNSNVNREFGGTGPNGPHGSTFSHILERRYEISQVAAGVFPGGGPGSLIINLNQSPPTDPASNGPYSLCAKCHNLANVLSNASWPYHQRHVDQEGVSCSVCHSSHGVPPGGSGTGKRLVNFDLNVVAPNGGIAAYSGTTCTLRCHMTDHFPNGSVQKVQ